MSNQLKTSMAVVAVAVLVVAGLFAVPRLTADDSLRLESQQTRAGSGAQDGSAPGGADGAPVVRPGSHVLGEPGDSGVELVEFLDFECEGCRAAYPVVERLRDEYAGRVTFVARYFPLPSHFNAERAARAVEAAARQGKFEQMYAKMFDTQTRWGEQREPMDDLFLSYANDLGLDPLQFNEDYHATATQTRVGRDVLDGKALGVTGTPTFFLEGERFEPTSYQDLTDALDEALDAANQD